MTGLLGEPQGRGHLCQYGPLRKCELCGVDVYQYAGPRVARPIYFESETGLQHSPRCGGVTDWVDAQLRELALPAWEQPGYHKPYQPQQLATVTRIPEPTGVKGNAHRNGSDRPRRQPKRDWDITSGE